MKSILVLATVVAAASSAPAVSAAPSSVAAVTPDQALYLKRLSNLGPQGLDVYDTTEAISGAAEPRPLPTAARPSLPQDVLAKARDYALSNRSKALLIWRDGRLEESVYGPGSDAATLIDGKSMGKPLGVVAIGRAIELKAIRSLDQRAADFITEWRSTPKAAITLRQLMNMTAGLAEQHPVKDPASVWTRAYLDPHHGEVIVNDYPVTAPPGTQYQYSGPSADLIGVVIERATGRRYARFLSEEVFEPLGAMGGKVWVDRPGGLAHAGCCILLPAETWLRLGLLLLDDGVWNGRRLLPKGYVAAMKTPSTSNPRYGLGVWIEGEYTPLRGFGRPGQALSVVRHSEPYLAKDLFLFDGNADQVLYMVPSEKLAILRMGDAPPKSPEWDNAFLPNLVLRAGARP